MDILSNYAKYRGKCKEMVDDLCSKDSTLTPVRGHHYCWCFGKQAHWWATKPDGTIVDPTVNQFPKPHIGEYVPFDGIVECEQCQKLVPEHDASFYGRYAFCSSHCQLQFLGVTN